MTTTRTAIQMTTERRGAAALDGAQHFQMLSRKPGTVALDEVVAVLSNDVGHLEGGPSHFLVLALEGAANVLDIGQREVVQRIRNRLQVSLRQMQILSGSLQVAMTEQHLDGTQVGAGF